MRPRLLGALALLALFGAAPAARAFVPPSFQSLGRGYGQLLGTYRLVDMNLQGIPMPPGFELRLVLTADTLELSMGNGTIENATYRVIDHYGEVYRLEVKSKTSSKKIETLELMLHGEILTLYEIDHDGSDKNKFRFERVK